MFPLGESALRDFVTVQLFDLGLRDRIPCLDRIYRITWIFFALSCHRPRGMKGRKVNPPFGCKNKLFLIAGRGDFPSSLELVKKNLKVEQEKPLKAFNQIWGIWSPG